MNGWFLAIIILGILNVGIHLGKHGERSNGKYNFWAALIGFLVSVVFTYMAIKTGF